MHVATMISEHNTFCVCVCVFVCVCACAHMCMLMNMQGTRGISEHTTVRVSKQTCMKPWGYQNTLLCVCVCVIFHLLTSMFHYKQAKLHAKSFFYILCDSD